MFAEKPFERRRRSSSWSALYLLNALLSVTFALETSGLRTKKFAGYPAAAACVRRFRFPSRSPAAPVGLGFGAARRPAIVEFAHVVVLSRFPYAVGLPASLLPVKYAR